MRQGNENEKIKHLQKVLDGTRQENARLKIQLKGELDTTNAVYKVFNNKLEKAKGFVKDSACYCESVEVVTCDRCVCLKELGE